MQLTDRQEEIVDFLRAYQQEHGVNASVRVLQRHFGFSSSNAAASHLRLLAKKKAIVQAPDGSWGVAISEVQGLFVLPVFGVIPAGRPDEREQAPEDTITVDPATFGVSEKRRGSLWALRVTGDSMIDACIQPGDIGVFERRDPREGEVIAALVDGTSTTLKRLVKVRGRFVLRAENKRYADIVPAEKLECQGVMVGLIRRMATAG